MIDLGASQLQAFAAEVREQLAAMYPLELRDPEAKSDPETVWGWRAFAGSADPQIVWMRRMAARCWTAPIWPRAYKLGAVGQGVMRTEVVGRRYE